VVEARQDTTVVLHPLADHRRQLPIERLGVHAGRRTRIRPRGGPTTPAIKVCSKISGFHPSAHGGHRFCFSRKPMSKSASSHTKRGWTLPTAAELVRFGQAIRRLETGGLREVASTRVLIAAGRLITRGGEHARGQRGPRSPGR